MINHDLRCIFVHIPRCAGTSIECWLNGRDWWEVEPSTKHLTAAQAKRVYSEWWNDYFKFSVVRNPYTRVPSLLKFSEHFGLRAEPGRAIDFSGYEALFGSDTILEHDHRFANRDLLLQSKHIARCVYGNILDEDLDFVGKFENLASDLAFVQDRLGLPVPFSQHVERSVSGKENQLTDEDRRWIALNYAVDFQTYGYDR